MGCDGLDPRCSAIRTPGSQIPVRFRFGPADHGPNRIPDISKALSSPPTREECLIVSPPPEDQYEFDRIWAEPKGTSPAIGGAVSVRPSAAEAGGIVKPQHKIAASFLLARVAGDPASGRNK